MARFIMRRKKYRADFRFGNTPLPITVDVDVEVGVNKLMPASSDKKGSFLQPIQTWWENISAMKVADLPEPN